MLLPVAARTRRAIVARTIFTGAIFSWPVELARTAIGALRSFGTVAIVTAWSAISPVFTWFEGPITTVFAWLERAFATVLARFERTSLATILARLVGAFLAKFLVIEPARGTRRTITTIFARLEGTLAAIFTRFERTISTIFARFIRRASFAAILSRLVGALLTKLLVVEPACGARRTIAGVTARRTVATFARLKGPVSAFTRFEGALATVFTWLERTLTAIFTGFIWGAPFAAVFARLVGTLLAKLLVFEPARGARRTISGVTARGAIVTIARLKGPVSAIARLEGPITAIARLEGTLTTVFAWLERTITTIVSRRVGALFAEGFVAKLLVAELAVAKRLCTSWSRRTRRAVVARTRTRTAF